MTHTRADRLGRIATWSAWALSAAGLSAAVVLDRRLEHMGRADLGVFAPEISILLAGMASALIVGAALTLRRSGHPVGWLFLGLGVSIAAAGPIDGYATYGAVARPGSLPGAAGAAHLGDVTFVPWLVLLALVLQLTPTGRPLSPRWGRLAWATVAAGLVAVLTAVFGERTLDAPFQGVGNPWAIHPLADVFGLAGGVATLLVGVGLVGAGLSMVTRYRRAAGAERIQLRWMFLAAAPLPLLVPAAFLSASTHHPAPLLLATGGFVVVIPVAAGLAITRFHLYEVDRILSRALTYGVLSAVLTVTYAAVVLATGRALSYLDHSSSIAAALATLVAVTIASPARGAIQDALDRQFNRRRFEALRYIDGSLRQSGSVVVDELLRQALGDPTLTVGYWSEQLGLWTTVQGQPLAPAASGLDVERDGRVIARVSFDTDAVEPSVVEAACAVAVSELDNSRLRAAIAAQLVEVNESRSRITAAQTVERRRLERNLHDGAQQRLLALAMNQQAALVNGGEGQLREALSDGIRELQATVGELRDLANGLHPSVLSDGGIGAALDDLARRSPIPMHLDVTDARFDAEVEACAWFVACEAITNAQKHAGADRIVVSAHAHDGWLEMAVEDDGGGGARRDGSGLQGIRDRASAAGGSLEVEDRPFGGTRVVARWPCGS
jgi:signal transduction histidine kinase